ncbi:TIGR02391 family protein [Microbacterium sp. HJ5]
MARNDIIQLDERFPFVAGVPTLRAARGALPRPKGYIVTDYEMRTRSGSSGRSFQGFETFVEMVSKGTESFSYGAVTHRAPGDTSIAGVRVSTIGSGTEVTVYTRDDETASAMMNAVRESITTAQRPSTFVSQPTRGETPHALQLTSMHPVVTDAAGRLFREGNYFHAELEAFKTLEHRVRRLTGLDLSGDGLMTQAFSPNQPQLDLSTASGQSGKDQQTGYMYLFRGAIAAVRNPKAHDPHRELDPEPTLEYLALASLLHRRLDVAEKRAIAK